MGSRGHLLKTLHSIIFWGVCVRACAGVLARARLRAHRGLGRSTSDVIGEDK